MKRKLENIKFGNLLVLRDSKQRKFGKILWECLCDCGNICIVNATYLKNGDTKSCGCLQEKLYDNMRLSLVGKKFNRWTILEELPERQQRGVLVKAQCECGTISIVKGSHIKGGHSKSCGCLRKENMKRLPKGEAAFNGLVADYKSGANNRGYEWRLTNEEFLKLIKGNCYYCNSLPLNIFPSKSIAHKYNGTINYNGIDRNDNSIGYSLDNSVSCCKLCNIMKMALSEDVFLEQTKKIFLHKLMTTA